MNKTVDEIVKGLSFLQSHTLRCLKTFVPHTVTYQALARKGLIETRVQGRFLDWEYTDLGRAVLNKLEGKE